MSTFSERLAAAKTQPRSKRDITITLDLGFSEQRAKLLEQIEAAKSGKEDDDPRLGSKPVLVRLQEQVDQLMAEAAETLVTLRFRRLPGDLWAEITARNPLRLDAVIDRTYGYNMQGVCKAAAPLSGVRLEGDEEFPLTVFTPTGDDDRPSIDEWADLFETISGHEFGLIMDAIYELNEYEPSTRIFDLKKGLATRPA
jgi:hypothetical protein